MAGCPRYTYKALNDASRNIRILCLLPGEKTEPLRIEIKEIEPRLCVPPPLHQLNLAQLEKTLPGNGHHHDYRVHVTRELRYIFCTWIEGEGGKGAWNTSWEHPDPNVPSELYQGVPEDAYWEPRYEALSYCWGPPTCVVDVLVAQKDGDATEYASIPIRSNLASALQHLRYPTTSRSLWVDAVCINQEDINERNTQVPRMKEIFPFAERVIFWLGEEAGSSSHAMSELQRIGQQIEITPDFFNLMSPGVENPTIDLDASFTILTDVTEEWWESISDLVERDWFYRMWITQEAQLARNRGRDSQVLCGNASMSWAELLRAMMFINESHQTPGWVPSQSHLYNDITDAPVSYSLWVLGGTSCTVPHDHIYGAWSFMPESFTSNIKPDYDAPLETVMREFTQAHIKHFQRLEVLSKCKWRDDAELILPSWTFNPLYSPDKYSDSDFCAGYSRACVEMVSTGKIRATGMVCGQISEVGRGLGGAPADIVRSVVEWQQTTGITGKALEAFIEVACCHYTQEREPENLQFAQSLGEIMTTCQESGIFRQIDLDDEDWEENLEFYERSVINDFISGGFRLVRTEDGRVGLASPGTSPGDKIALFLGCDTAIIIRPAPDKTFKVIGPCAFSDLLDAKAFLGPLPSPWRVQVFTPPSSHIVYRFYNNETDYLVGEDPRLGPLVGWERVDDIARGNEHPLVCQFYRNLETGEVVDWDPRMEREALERRGVELEDIILS